MRTPKKMDKPLLKKLTTENLEEQIRHLTNELEIRKGQLTQGANRERLGADREKIADEKFRKQTNELEIRDGRLKQGADREKRGANRERQGADRERLGAIREKQGTDREKLGADRELLGADREKQKDLEIEEQRELLLHVTRVGKLAEFVSSLAHEISQPLTAILAYAQAAQHMFAGREPQLQEILQYIVNDDQRATEVIRRLRSLLKKTKPTFEPLNINAVIKDTVSLIMTHITVRHKIVKFELASDLPLIAGDRIQLQQVILNLISNSLEAMDEKSDSSELLIKTFRNNTDSIMVEVKDSGCGIAEENVKNIFVRFYTSKPDGLGMGLSISRSIVDAHGGCLEARNNPDCGATFYFTMPIMKPVQ
jgi:signal transduction histidine kinase